MTKKLEMKLVCHRHRPTYSNGHAAGLDLRIMTDEPLIIPPEGHSRIMTGVHMEIPAGYFGLIAIRSGLGSRGLTLSNSVGIIDEDYRGEIMIPVYNHGTETFQLEDGERVAQLILIPTAQADLVFVDQLGETDRGTEGFGSSGRF